MYLEAGLLTLKYLNNYDLIVNEKNLYIKMAKSMAEEEEQKTSSNLSLCSIADTTARFELDQLMIQQPSPPPPPPSNPNLDSDSIPDPDPIQGSHSTQDPTRNPDNQPMEIIDDDSDDDASNNLNLFNLNIINHDLNIDDLV